PLSGTAGSGRLVLSVSSPFIKRPVGTSLLTIGLLLAGILAFQFLPVAPLPQVEFPVIQVGASLPGASPETMCSAVATPLERQFARIAGITQMTSTSQIGSTGMVLQLHVNRCLDDAVRGGLGAANANSAKRRVANAINAWTIQANDQIKTADKYQSLIVSYKNGAAVRLSVVAKVSDSVADTRVIGLSAHGTSDRSAQG